MNESEAVEHARRIASDNGWTWLEPVDVRRRGGWLARARWIVVSNASHRGMNVRVVLDDRSGSVLEKGFLPR
jgi:hypothetical protein